MLGNLKVMVCLGRKTAKRTGDSSEKTIRMAEDGEDLNGLQIMILKSLAIFFFKIHERDVAPLKPEPK